MTYEEREAIFAKEVLTNKDIQELFAVCASEASKIINQIKRKTGDRLGVKGRVHIQEYFDYFEITSNRYTSKELCEAEKENYT